MVFLLCAHLPFLAASSLSVFRSSGSTPQFMSKPTGPVLSCKEHWPISYETKKKLRFGARILAVQIIYPDLACRETLWAQLASSAVCQYAPQGSGGVAFWALAVFQADGTKRKAPALENCEGCKSCDDE
jgi:hypothetical protein